VIQAAVDEVGKQRAGQGGVLRRALPQPERDLDALSRDAERDDVSAIGDLQAVEHHHRQAHVIQPAAHQLGKRGAGALDEYVRDRGLARRGRRLLDAGADRFANISEAAGGDTGEHPVHHRPGERIAVGEVLVALNGQLALVGRAHPRATDLHATATQRHRPVIVAMANRDAITVVLALRTDNLVHLELHQLVHHAQPDTHAERQQSLPRRTRGDRPDWLGPATNPSNGPEL
jgi:hypothetical protein